MNAITVADVMASKPVAMPLKLWIAPRYKGGAALKVSREPTSRFGVRVRGCAQAHTHQHITAAPALSELQYGGNFDRQGEAGLRSRDLRCSLCGDLRQLYHHAGGAAKTCRLAGRGEAAAGVGAGHFSRDGAMRLNTHGGLLSYGQSASAAPWPR